MSRQQQFRWMSPIAVRLSPQLGIRDRDKEGFLAFLTETVEFAQNRGLKVTSPRTDADARLTGWSTATRASQLWPVEVFQGSWAPSTGSNQTQDRDSIQGPITWTLYDFGVFLVEGFMNVDDVEADRAHQIEDEIRDVCAETARRCAAEVMRAIGSAAAQSRDVNHYLAGDAAVAPEVAWVTRALQLHRGDPDAEAFSRAWVEGVDAIHEDFITRLLEGQEFQVARWMNHVHDTGRQREVDEDWEALKYAQFFWTALQSVDEELRFILSMSMAPPSEYRLAALRTELNSTLDRAVALTMTQDEFRQYAPRKTREAIYTFFEAWSYDEDLRAPVEKKMELCNDRITSLTSEQQERSSIATDLILMGIGLTSLLATAVALVQFGRSALSDPGQSMFDLGNGRITSWLSSQSMDSVLLISLLLSAFLLGLFAWQRRRR